MKAGDRVRILQPLSLSRIEHTVKRLSTRNGVEGIVVDALHGEVWVDMKHVQPVK